MFADRAQIRGPRRSDPAATRGAGLVGLRGMHANENAPVAAYGTHCTQVL